MRRTELMSIFAAAVAIAFTGSAIVSEALAFAPTADRWTRELAAFEINLNRNGEHADRGVAANVLDAPLSALRALVGVLAADPHNPPLAAGEIVTTGSLTRALPIAEGEIWTTELKGVALDGISLELAPRWR